MPRVYQSPQSLILIKEYRQDRGSLSLQGNGLSPFHNSLVRQRHEGRQVRAVREVPMGSMPWLTWHRAETSPLPMVASSPSLRLDAY